MNRAWFQEKVADKLLFGVIATCVTGLAFAQYDAINEKVTYAEKNVDTYISYEKSNFDRVISAIDSSITELSLFNAGAQTSTLALQTAIVKSATDLQSANSAFDVAGLGQHLPINVAMAACLDIYSSDPMQADKVASPDDGANRGAAIISLVSCRDGLLPAFDEFLQAIVTKSFDNAVTLKSIGYGPIRTTIPTLMLSALLLLTGGLAILWYARSPEK